MKSQAVIGGLFVMLDSVSAVPAVASSVARQTCTDHQLAAIADELATRSELQGLRLVASACSVAPKQLGAHIIVYVALDSEGSGYLDVSLRNKQEAVGARSSFPIDEDAGLRFETDSLWIDVAPYNLNSSTRAFGIDITSGYTPNCGDGGFGDVRTLYEARDHRIVPVLQDLFVTEWVYRQQSQSRCNSLEGAADTAIIEHFGKTIELAESWTNGRRDLVIVGRSEFEYQHSDGTLESKPSVRPIFRFLLRYDGQSYPLEDFQEAWWEWRT